MKLPKTTDLFPLETDGRDISEDLCIVFTDLLHLKQTYKNNNNKKTPWTDGNIWATCTKPHCSSDHICSLSYSLENIWYNFSDITGKSQLFENYIKCFLK